MSNIINDKKFHFIYKTTNLLNEKFYYGMHSTSNLKDGYLGSGKRLGYSINKHGIENFKCEILEFLPDRETLIAKEIELITEEMLQHPLCMNLKTGGEGGLQSKENRLKRANAACNAFKLKLKTNPEFKAKFGESGRKVLLDAKVQEKGRKTRLEKYGSSNTWLGRTHSDETKQQMKTTRELNKSGVGERNSQFGTQWVHNNETSKKIKKEELDLYLANNWIAGRKLKFEDKPSHNKVVSN